MFHDTLANKIMEELYGIVRDEPVQLTHRHRTQTELTFNNTTHDELMNSASLITLGAKTLVVENSNTVNQLTLCATDTLTIKDVQTQILFAGSDQGMTLSGELVADIMVLMSGTEIDLTHVNMNKSSAPRFVMAPTIKIPYGMLGKAIYFGNIILTDMDKTDAEGKSVPVTRILDLTKFPMGVLLKYIAEAAMAISDAAPGFDQNGEVQTLCQGHSFLLDTWLSYREELEKDSVYPIYVDPETATPVSSTTPLCSKKCMETVVRNHNLRCRIVGGTISYDDVEHFVLAYMPSEFIKKESEEGGSTPTIVKSPEEQVVKPAEIPNVSKPKPKKKEESIPKEEKKSANDDFDMGGLPNSPDTEVLN